jgi:hypothetical protein
LHYQHSAPRSPLQIDFTSFTRLRTSVIAIQEAICMPRLNVTLFHPSAEGNCKDEKIEKDVRLQHVPQRVSLISTDRCI